MPTYLFRARDGEEREAVFPMQSCPRRFKTDGKTYWKVPVAGAGVLVSRHAGHVSSALPRWCPGASEYVTKGPKEEIGKPIIRGLRDIRNIEAASDGLYRYDRQGSERAQPWTPGRSGVKGSRGNFSEA